MKHSDSIKVRVDNHTFVIKNLEVYERMSEETTAFCADLYIGDFFIGTCENNGKGEGNYPRIYADNKNDREIAEALYSNIVEGVAKHHYYRVPTTDYPYVCDWDYDMDFLIADMVYTAWYFGRKTYKFADEK